MTAIMLLALIPPPALPQAPGSDKFQHAIAFCFLTVLLQLSHPGLARIKGALIMVGCGCLMNFYNRSHPIVRLNLSICWPILWVYCGCPVGASDREVN